LQTLGLRGVLLLLTLSHAVVAAAQPQAPVVPDPAQAPSSGEQAPDDTPVYEEQVVVTASRFQQDLVNAPATVTVITSDVIQSSPATSYAELLRAVPGMNVTQTSARDFNLNMRGATSTLATSQLVLIDGRSLYLDYFGFVAWDFLPVNPNELRQIEVIRGPASAVWGANALSGVINFITKTPREIAGDSFTLGIGGFGRDVPGRSQGAGAVWYANGTHAQAVNERWSYKVSAGAYMSDALPRPAGTIPNIQQTPYPPFQNAGTLQPKVDGRVDYDADGGVYGLSFSGGYAGSEGITHTGIGPFDNNRGTGLGYGQVRYTRKALRATIFANLLDGDASSLLTVGPTGQPILFRFNTKTYDGEVLNLSVVGRRHVLSYGGNLRYQAFDLSIAPRGDNRREIGAYLQDEIFVSDRIRLVLGARADYFSVLDGTKFNPRTAFIFKPAADHAIRVSYNKAFRAPSLVNNFLEAPVVNQVNLQPIAAAVSPALGQLFAGRTYPLVTPAIGNLQLKEQSLRAYEIAYTGQVRNRATISIAFYVNRSQDAIALTQTGRYRATDPPPGWVEALSPIPPAVAAAVLDLLPPPCGGLTLPCTTGGLPAEFSYRNLGTVTDKGLELGTDMAVNRALNLFANYSYQFQPVPSFDLSELNLPPTHRVNTGFSYSQGRFTANANASYQSEAFWQDVLDARYHGPTDAFTQVSGAFGVRWLGDTMTTTLKVNNLLDQPIQTHVFGDVVRRQVIGELRVVLGAPPRARAGG
jgi:outer membrane receptor protein involved in Fe transport